MSELLKSKWISLSEEEKSIMGRPNFTCGKIAHRMRDMGFDVEKSEQEQALVIWTMLEFYKEHGKDWGDKMSEFLKNNKPTS